MRPVSTLSARFSLRARLTVLSALGAALVLPLGVLYLHGDLGDALDDAVTAELRVRADDVAAELIAGFDPVLGEGLVTQVLAADGSVLDGAGSDPLLAADELPSQLDAEVVVDRPVPGIGADARVLGRSVNVDGTGRRYVLVAGSTAPIARAQDRVAVVLGVVGPVLVVLIAATAWMLTRAALRPVRRMTRRAATLSLEEPRSRLPLPPGRDEIAELGQTLNVMLDRIEETVAHERAFVDDASHELRTPIAVLRGELELARLDLAEGRDPAESIRAIDSALEETDRLARVAEHLLVLARADAGRLTDGQERVPLMAATARVVDRLDLGDLDLQVTGVEAHVMADPDLVNQMITNLVANAARFAASTVRVEIRTEATTVVLSVADDGPGFAPDLLDSALDRFSRAEPSRTRTSAGSGAGLGLSIVAAIADALDGRVSLSNGGPLGGACIELRLPRAEHAP